jgi:hypothetical protein
MDLSTFVAQATGIIPILSWQRAYNTAHIIPFDNPSVNTSHQAGRASELAGYREAMLVSIQKLATLVPKSI